MRALGFFYQALKSPDGNQNQTTTTHTHMKIITAMKSSLKAIVVAACAVSLATSVSAAPPGKGVFKVGSYKHAGTVEEIQSLKTGDQYALVCSECKSIAVKEVADEKEVEALCHDGGSIHCDSCDKKFTVKRTGPPGKGATSQKVTIVNAEGKECMFIVPMKA